MSKTFLHTWLGEVDSSIPGEVEVDDKVFFLLHAFLVFLGVVGGAGSSVFPTLDFPFLFGVFDFP